MVPHLGGEARKGGGWDVGLGLTARHTRGGDGVTSGAARCTGGRDGAASRWQGARGSRTVSEGVRGLREKRGSVCLVWR